MRVNSVEHDWHLFILRPLEKVVKIVTIREIFVFVGTIPGIYTVPNPRIFGVTLFSISF